MPLPDFEPTMVVSDAQRGLAGPQRRILDLDRCMVELEINAPGRLSAFQDCPGVRERLMSMIARWQLIASSPDVTVQT